MNELLQDLRYGVRTLRKNPGFATVAVLTLAIGIGANTAIFSFVNGVLLKPLPYGEPERIVRVLEKPPGGDRNGISTLNYLDWQKENTVFEYMAAQTGGSVTLTGVNEPIQLRGARVSQHYFDIFGIKAVLGRTFAANEDQPGKEHVAVLSHALWDSQFGADPTVIGRTITAGRRPYTVIGVLPPGGAFDRAFAQIWRPLAFEPQNMTRNFHWFGAFAKLKRGVTLKQATGANGCNRRPNRAGLSGFQQRMGRGGRPVRRHGGRHAVASISVRLASRRRHGSADRLREPGESDPGTRHGART